MINWLRKNQKFLSISAIGESIGAKDQLLKAVRGARPLPKKHRSELSQLLRGMGLDFTQKGLTSREKTQNLEELI